MEALIIEDEIPAANKLIKLLASIDESIEILDACRTIEASVKWLKNHAAPDLIFMDIELTDGKSFEIFEQVKVVSPIIFITAYNEYAIKAIKLHALDYLLKPVTKPMLTEALKEFKEHKEVNSKIIQNHSELQKLINDLAGGKAPKKLAINSREGISFISMDNILRLQADSNYTHIFLEDGKKITTSKTLKEYEELLMDYGFFRVHNAHVIHLQFVEKYLKGEGGYVIMKDGTSIEVSQLRKKGLMSALQIE